jgi:hypothetical protein
MPKILYVTRIYEVVIPDDRVGVNKAIDEDYTHPSDADIVKGSDEAIAVFLSYQYDVGNYTEAVNIHDVTVSDKVPNVEEFVRVDIP